MGWFCRAVKIRCTRTCIFACICIQTYAPGLALNRILQLFETKGLPVRLGLKRLALVFFLHPFLWQFCHTVPCLMSVKCMFYVFASALPVVSNAHPPLNSLALLAKKKTAHYGSPMCQPNVSHRCSSRNVLVLARYGDFSRIKCRV